VRKATHTLLLLLLLCSSQCIVFSSYRLPPENTPATVSGQRTVLLSVTQAQTVGSEKVEARELDRKKTQDSIIRALSKHSAVAGVVTDPAQSHDIKLAVSVDSQVSTYQSTPGMIFTFLSFLTATVLPFDVDQTSRLSFRFTRPADGATLKTEHTAHFNIWVGILTLPLMPFLSPGQVADRTFRDLVHASVNEAIERNLF